MMFKNYSVFPILTIICWIILFGYWIALAYIESHNNAKNQNELYGFLKLAGIPLVLYVPWSGWGWIGLKLYPPNKFAELLGTLLCVSGVFFAIWARGILGRNWSGNVVIQKNHKLIQQGPYRLVRHPIYAGGIFAIVGSAIVLGRLWGLIVAVISFFGLYQKTKREEKLLCQQFPNEYPQYKQRVKGLIPFIF